MENKYNNRKCNKKITIKENQKNFNNKLIGIIDKYFNNTYFIQFCIVYDKLILDNNNFKLEIKFKNNYGLGNENRYLRNDFIIDYLLENYFIVYKIDNILYQYAYRIK